MINAHKYAMKKMMDSQGNGYLLAEYQAMIEEIQKDAYNQAIEDASKSADIKVYRSAFGGKHTLYISSVIEIDQEEYGIVNTESILKLKK